MTMIKVEVPNSDIDAIELAGEFFTNLAIAKRSTIAQVMSHIHGGKFEGEVTQSPIENVTDVKQERVKNSDLMTDFVNKYSKEDVVTFPVNPDAFKHPYESKIGDVNSPDDVEVPKTELVIVTGELKEELNVTYDRVENPSDLIPDTITESPKTHNVTIPTPEQAEEFKESMTEMEFVTPPPIEIPSQQDVDDVVNHTREIMESITPPPIPTVPSVPSVPIAPSELPYDERIHSSGKTRNQDGTWKLRRRPADMDEEQWKDYIEQCELENAKLMQLGGGDTSENVEKITFEELIMKIQPQLAVPNPDFEKQCQAIATSLGLNHMSDLRRAEHLIPEFLKQLDLDGQGVN